MQLILIWLSLVIGVNWTTCGAESVATFTTLHTTGATDNTTGGNSSQGDLDDGVDCGNGLFEAYVLKNWTFSQLVWKQDDVEQSRLNLFYSTTSGTGDGTSGLLYQEVIFMHDTQTFLRIGQPVKPARAAQWPRFPEKAASNSSRTFDRIVGSVKGFYYFGWTGGYTYLYAWNGTNYESSRTMGISQYLRFVSHYNAPNGRQIQWSLYANQTANGQFYLSLTYWVIDSGKRLEKDQQTWPLSSELNNLLVNASSFVITDLSVKSAEFNDGRLALITGACYTHSIIIPGISSLLNQSEVSIVRLQRYSTFDLVKSSYATVKVERKHYKAKYAKSRCTRLVHLF